MKAIASMKRLQDFRLWAIVRTRPKRSDIVMTATDAESLRDTHNRLLKNAKTTLTNYEIVCFAPVLRIASDAKVTK